MNQTFVIANIFSENSIEVAIKIILLVATVFFIIFSFLTIRQVGLMNRTIINNIHFEVRLLAYFQFFVGIGVFFAVLLFN